jgi:two-component sensor histidine kinase
VVPIFNASGQIIGALVSETFPSEDRPRLAECSISADRTAADLAEFPTDSLLTLIQYLNDAIIVFDKQWRAIHLNRAAADFYKRLGYLEAIQGMHIGNLILDREMYDEIRKDKKDIGKEIAHGSLALHVQCIFINHGSEVSMALIISDLSELRAKDRELVLKSVAVQEIHHRIKNNLQTISSILRLQARRSRDDNTRHVLQENINRILSIAATHEILAKKGLDCLEINSLLCRIKDNILRYGMPGGKDINVNVSGDAFQVMSSEGTTVALVVNELLSNALEHAFVERDQGEILITIAYGSPQATIVVEDNGIGFDFSEVRDDNLGFGIVRALIKDTLGGEMDISSGEAGSRIEFTFKT